MNTNQSFAPVDSSSYPREFEPLITEKIRSFCGRKFVFDAFGEFINNHPKGYFTVIGDAGMGKSAISAKYVFDHPQDSICYFNILVERRNRPDLFLKSVRHQLINRYQLLDANNDDLKNLLAKVTQKLSPDERLVIVVDALNEVEQEPGEENILYLPTTLPDRVYFLLTRRPYSAGRERLYTYGVPKQELVLTNSNYEKLNQQDVQDYIRLFIHHDPEYKQALNHWTTNRNLKPEVFIEQIAAKSKNNFMYLRYVLPEIACGLYNDMSLKELPDGLEEYYQTHWARMGMDNKPQQLMVIILFILVEIGTPIPCEMVADIAQEDSDDVQKILNTWVEYLKPQEIDGDRCYGIYHASFLDFLKGKRELDKNRKLLKEVNQLIVDYWKREMGNDDADCE